MGGWLKKAGMIVAQALSIVVGVGPLFTGRTATDKDDKAVAVAADYLSQIAELIALVEAANNALTQPLPGSEKLKMATPMVAQVILSSAMMAKHEIGDPERFKGGCSQVASGMAEILSSLKDKVEVINKA